MEMTRKTWMLAALLSLGIACGDDDEESLVQPDGGSDAAVPDAGNIDAGHDASSIDAALSDAARETGIAPIAVIGKWSTKYDPEEITATKWSFAYLVEWDNEARIAITQDPPSDAGPGKYSKIVWTPVVNGTFYYCFQDYGKNTIAEAYASTMKLDASDPDNSGCGDGDFEWTKMTLIP